jgi:predicted P-loop ATPase
MNKLALVDSTNATEIPGIAVQAVPGHAEIAAHKVSFTFFKDEYASSLTTKSVTLPELRGLILATNGQTKGSLPWLKGARFGNKRSDKNSLRTDENVLGFDLIELDYDKDKVSFDEAVNTIKEMNVRALVYTTPSHTPAAPRWRVLLPVSRGDLPLENRGKYCARVNGRFGNVFANESFALSQSYYFGLALDNAAPDHRCEVIDGRLIDLCDDLYKYQANGFPKAQQQPVKTTAGNAAGNGSKFYDRGFNFENHLENIGDGDSLLGFNEPLTRATASYAYHHGTDFDREALKTRLREAVNAAPKKANRKASDIERYLSDKYLDETIASAVKKYGTAKQNGWGDFDWRERKANGQPSPSMHNARLAITALGITCSMDTFHNKTLFGYADDKVKHELASIVGEVSDNGIIALRQLMSDRFGFDLTDKHTRDAVVSLALEHCFDPVRDLIDKAEAEWDGIERLDSMAVEYFNCEGTEINCAFMRKTMIGLVARARTPGCKFDTITVLESKEGFNKSTAWKVLAGDDNFSDERILGKESREVQEQLSGVWIHENADLAGLKKTDIESVKAYASRQTDIARAAFAHFVVKQPRHSIEVGTTNSSEYLQSQTGNRRFWPLEVLAPIDVKKLTEYRLQLIGEAARYQSQGESVVLDEKLWGAAGYEQEQRRVKDPWEDVLEDMPKFIEVDLGYEHGFSRKETVTIIHREGMQEMVASSDLMKYLLEIPVAHQTTATGMRVANVMKQLGWQRHKNGHITISRQRQKGFFRWLEPAEAPRF